MQESCQKLLDVTVVDKPIEVNDVLDYFWHHLEKDIQTLCRTTQLGFDDCILLLHTLIHKMLFIRYEDETSKLL